MSTVTSESAALRGAIAAKHDALDEILGRYRALNPRLFGSVARADASVSTNSDRLRTVNKTHCTFWSL